MSIDSFGQGGEVYSLPEAKNATVKKDGRLYIGDVAMIARYKGEVIQERHLLEKIAKLLNKNYEMSDIYKMLFSEQVPNGKLSIAKEGIKVIKPSTTVSMADVTKSHFSNDFESIEAKLVQKQHFSEKLKAFDRFPPNVVREAIDNILDEPHTSLGEFLEGNFTPEHSLGAVSKSVGDLLHEPGNEGLHAALISRRDALPSAPIRDKKVLKECDQKLRHLLLDTMQRNPKAVHLDDGSSFVQTFERGQYVQSLESGPIILDNDFRKRHHAIPSQLDTKENRRLNPDIQTHNTNLGSVALYDLEGNIERVVATRSGRSDTPERLQEVVVDALLNQIQSKYQIGLTSNPATGLLEFRHEITSHLDLGWAKGTSERKELFAILQAVDGWPQEGYRVKVIINGKEETVVLKKPLLRAQSLSALAEGTPITSTRKVTFGSGLDDAYRFNFVSNQQCLMRYLKNVPEELKPAHRALNELLKKCLKEERSFLSEEGVIDFDLIPQGRLYDKGEFFADPRYREYMQQVAICLLNAVDMRGDEAAAALYTMLFHREIPLSFVGGRYVYDTKQEKQGAILFKQQSIQASDLEIYSHIVFDATNLSCGKQCKSGKDRTPIGYSLKVAQCRFQREKGYEFVPSRAVRNPEDLQLFKNYYRESLAKFGFEVTVESYGYAGLKWASGITDNTTGLQYMPESVSYSEQRREILGKTTKSTLKEAVKAQRSLEDPALKAQAHVAKEEVEKYLKEKVLVGVFGPNEAILTDNLELRIHIKRLKLEEKIEGKSRVEQIQAKINNLILQHGHAVRLLDTIRGELSAKPENVAAMAQLDENEKIVQDLALQIYALSRVVQLHTNRKEAKEVLAIVGKSAQQTDSQPLTLEQGSSAARVHRAARLSFRPNH